MSSPETIGFGRHSLAVLAASTAAAIAYAAIVTAMIIVESPDRPAMAFALAPLVLLAVFVFTFPVAAIVYSAAWPAIRHRPRWSAAVSSVMGGLAGAGLIVANKRIVAGWPTATELLTCAALGGFLGIVYWRVAQRG